MAEPVRLTAPPPVSGDRPIINSMRPSIRPLNFPRAVNKKNLRGREFEKKRHPSRPVSRVLCGGLPRPAIIPLGARVAARLKQPTRGSDGASSAVSPEGGHLCLALLPTGVARPSALRRTPVVSYTAVSPSPGCRQPGNALLCGPGPAGRPALGIARRRALWSADFPRSRKRNRDRPADLDTKITITLNSGWARRLR
jgi:hypothetical protein